MRFAIASEGRTDYIVLKNLLIGFSKDKNLPVTRLRPKENEPFGWGNLLNYIASSEFRGDCEDDNIDYLVIQVDTDKCEEWTTEVKTIGDNAHEVNDFINGIIDVLIQKIGDTHFSIFKHKIVFAICVHEMECWLLPFHAQLPAHQSKMVGCANKLEQIAAKSGFSINQKDYEGGKHYNDLSKDMKNNKELMAKYHFNPSLKVFVESLTVLFSK